MRAGVIAFSPLGIVGFAFAFFLFANALFAAQSPETITAELQRVREALNKYRDPILAVHDGYFSTVGCVEYPKPGAAGQVAPIVRSSL